MNYSNVQRVRILYKTILRLHRGLPKELNELGTKYCQEEFKRHKRCDKAEAEIFINEWTDYALTLAKQLGLRGPRSGEKIGTYLKQQDLGKFRDEQLYQLHELMEATRSNKSSQ